VRLGDFAQTLQNLPPLLACFVKAAVKTLDRLSIQSETETILNVAVRSVTLPVAVGRNLAVLVEAAVRNYILQARGKDSTKEFLERHQSMMNKPEESNHENHPD